jgi:sugar phosphate isomerase/epimerase
MKSSQVAAQLFTVRDYLLDPSAFAQSIKRLKAIGYSAVELIPSESVSDDEIARICGEDGVKVAAAHVRGDVLLERPEAIVKKLRVLGTSLAVYAYPAGVDLSSRPRVERLADELERSAQVLRQAGLTLAYHNHAMEFCRLDGELVYNIIRNKAPALSFELDAYWVQYGGMSPERWIRELGGKLVSVHLKDFGVPPSHGEPPFMAEVGQGNLDFHTIAAEAERAGCNWFVVEQDITPGDPFASLERSLRYVEKELMAAPIAANASSDT